MATPEHKHMFAVENAGTMQSRTVNKCSTCKIPLCGKTVGGDGADRYHLCNRPARHPGGCGNSFK
jgi:hypothetical protein